MKHFLLRMALCLLALTVPALAEAAGGGHGGGGNAGGGYGGGRGYGYGGYGGRGYGYGYGGGFYGGFYLGGYPYYGGYYDYPYEFPYNAYPSGAPYVVVGPGADRSPYYSGGPSTLSTPPSFQPPPVPVGNTANIQVLLPDPNAKVLIDDRPTSTAGAMRTLATPELTPGQTFQYNLTATWVENGQTITDKRRIEVKAGSTTVVDFSRPLATLSP